MTLLKKGESDDTIGANENWRSGIRAADAGDTAGHTEGIPGVL